MLYSCLLIRLHLFQIEGILCVIFGLRPCLYPTLSKPALPTAALIAFFPLCPPPPPPAGYSFHNAGECLSLNEMEMVEDY